MAGNRFMDLTQPLVDVFHALPEGVQSFARSIVDPEEQNRRDQEKSLASKVPTQQEYTDTSEANKLIYGNKNVADLMDKQGNANNLKFPQTIDDLKQVQNDSNTLFAQATSNVNKSLTTNWDNTDSVNNKDLVALENQKFNSAINFIKNKLPSDQADALLTDPVVSKVLARRAATSNDQPGQSRLEKLGGVTKMFFSPWLAAASGTEEIAGQVSGNQALKNEGKASIGYRYGDPEMAANPESYSIGHAGMSYLTHGGMRDVVPVAWMEGSTLLRNMKGGEGAVKFADLVAQGEKEMTPLLPDIKTALTTDKVLMKHVDAAGLDVANATEKDISQFMINNPKAQERLVGNIAKKAGPAGIEQVNAMSQPINDATKFRMITPTTVAGHLKSMVSDYYRMSPRGMGGMLKIAGVQAGVETIGSATQNDTVKELGGLVTQPVETLMHLAGINKQTVLDRVTNQFAQAYGMTPDAINKLPADNPFKQQLLKAANTIYNQESFVQTLGITPTSRLGKIAASLLDTAVDFAGVSVWTHGVPKILGSTIDSMTNPYTKQGDINIKGLADVEGQLKGGLSLDQAVDKVQQMYKDKNVSLPDQLKATRLLNESIAGIQRALDTARQSFGATFGKDVEAQLQKCKNIMIGTDKIEISQNAAAEMKKLSAMTLNMLETSVSLSQATKFRGDLQQHSQRAAMSLEMLNHVRDSVGYGNAIKKAIIKGLAPSYASWSNFILNDDFYKKYGTAIESSIRDANNIAKGNKLTAKEAQVMKSYFKQNENGNYLIQEVDTAINNKIDTMLGSMSELDSAAKEKFANVIRDTVHTTIFKSMFLQYDKLLNTKDIESILKTKDLSAISSDILAYLFTGKEFPTGKKSSLGETLKQIQDSKGQGSNSQALVDRVTEAALKFPGEVLSRVSRSVSISTRQRADELSESAKAIQTISSFERGLSTQNDLIRAGEIWKAPQQFVDILGEGFGKIQKIIGESYDGYLDDPKQKQIESSVADMTQGLREHEAIYNLDTSSFSDILAQSIAKTDSYHTYRMSQQANQEKATDTAQEAVAQFNDVLQSSVPGLNLQVTSKGNTLPISLNDTIEGFKEFSNSRQSIMQPARDSFQAMKAEQGSTDESKAPLNPEDLKIDPQPAQIAQDLTHLISKDPGFGEDTKSIKPAILSNTDLFNHANKSTTVESFAENVLQGMGYPEGIGTFILTHPGYANVAFDLKNKFWNFKDGVDATAMTDNWKLKQQGWDQKTGNPIVITQKDTAPDYPKYELKSDAMLQLDPKSDAVKNIKIVNVDYNNRPNLNPNRKDIPTARLAAYTDVLNQLNAQYPDRIFIQTTDGKTSFYTFKREDIDAMATKQGIQLQSDPQRAYYTQLKMGGVDKVLGDGRAKLFDGSKLANKTLAEIARGQQKYLSKETSTNIKDPTNFGPALVLHETSGDPQDGMIFAGNDAFKNGLAYNSAQENEDHYTTSFKVQVNGDGRGIKGDAHELTPQRLTEQLLVPENYERAVEYIEQQGGPNMNGSSQQEVAEYLMGNGLNYVVMDSAIKDYLKNVPEESWKQLGIEEPAKAKRLNLPIEGVRYYSLKGDVDVNTAQYDKGTRTNQSNQHVYGEAGDMLQQVLSQYTKNNESVPSMYLPQIFDFIKNDQRNELQTYLATKLNIFTNPGDKSGIVNVDPNGNILAMGPQLQGILKNIVKDNLFAQKLPGHIITLAGIPETIKDKLLAEYPAAADGNYIIASKLQFAGNIPNGKVNNLAEVEDQVNQRRQSGDPVIMHRYPVTGPKSFVAPKVYFIEDLPASIKQYFLTNAGKPVQEIYISPELIQKKEADFDGDTTHMFPELSKQTTPDGTPLGEYMQGYQAKVDADPLTMAKTEKSTFQDLQKTFGTDFHEAGPHTLAFVRQFAKDLTAQTSAISRGVSILNRDIFGGQVPTEKLINLGNKGAGAIQASVDGNMAGPYSQLFDARMGKGGFNELAFPNLSKINLVDIKKPFQDRVTKNIMQGKGGVFEYLGKIADTGKPLALRDQIDQVKNSQEAMGKVLKLKAIDNLLGQNKITTQDASDSLNGRQDSKAITDEVARLRGINNSDPKVGLNKAKMITNADYSNIINYMVNDYAQLNLASILQEMNMPGELPTKELVDNKILTPGFELKGKTNVDKFITRLSKPKNTADGERLAVTALSLNLEPLLPIVQQLYPEVVNQFNLFAQKQAQGEGYITTMSNAINQISQDPALNTLLKNIGNYADNKYQIGAYLLRGDTEGLQKFLESNPRIKVQEPTTRMDSAVSKEVAKNDTTDLRDVNQKMTIKDVVNNYFTKLLGETQDKMYQENTSPEVNKSKGAISQIYDLVKNGNRDLVNSFANPINDIRKEIASIDPDAAQNPFLEQYIQQLYDNMYPLLAKQIHDQSIGHEAVAENKSDMTKQTSSMRRKMNDLKYDAMKTMGASHAETMHGNLLDTYQSVRELIENDAQFQKQLVAKMTTYTDKGMSMEDARQTAIQDMANDYANIQLTDETKQKIQDTTKTQLGTIGETVSSMVNDTAKQLKALGSFGVDFNRDAQYYKDQLDNAMLEQAYKTNNGIDFLGSIINTMNTIYKSTMVGASVGRRVLEMSGAGMNLLLNRWIHNATPDEASFMKRMEWNGTLKTNRNFDDTTSFKERNKFTAKFFDQYKTWPKEVQARWQETIENFVGKIPEYTFGHTLPGKQLEAFKNTFFKQEMYTALEQQIKYREQQTPGFADKAKRWLTTDNASLTADQKYQKTAFLKEVERIASKNTKDAFFDYSSNPMFVARLEQYMPYTNFLFNSAKVFTRSSLGAAAWVTALNFCTNITQEFSNPQIDIDDESLKGYMDINKASLPILGMLGFSNLGFDLNRAMPIDITNPSFFGYPYQKLWFPTQDPQYTRMMTDNNYHWYDYALSKISPALGDLISPLTTHDQSGFRRRLGYMTIGLSRKDPTAVDMVKAFYSKDYDTILNRGSYALNQFNAWRSKNGQTELSRSDIQAYKYFQDTVFGNSKTSDSKFDYIAMMADYLAYKDFMPQQNGLIYKDVDTQKTIVKALKGLLTDTATGLVRNNDGTLTDKIIQMSQNTIDASGGRREKKKGEKSILDMVGNVGQLGDFMERLNWIGDNGNVLSQYGKAASNWDTPENNAIVGAFRYHFQEEANDPKWANLEQSNSEEYFKQKVQAIQDGTLKTPAQLPVKDAYGSSWALTKQYKDYLQYGKGIVLQDMEAIKGKINTLTILRNLQYEGMDKNPNHAQYYWSQINKITQQITDAKAQVETYQPTLNDLNNIHKDTEATYGNNMANTYKSVKTRINGQQKDYLKSKIQNLWKNILADANATVKFTTENGINPKKLVARYEGELKMLG